MIRQRTLKNEITGAGVGLHKGVKIQMKLKPAPVNTGIVFRRTDLNPLVEIPACVENVSCTRLSTTIGINGAEVSTVEHLMSAFAGLGVDNAYVDVTAGEVPIMDGSSHPFVFLMEAGGLELQSAPKKFIRIKKAVTVQEGDMWAKFEPYHGFKISFAIDFDHPVIKNSNQRVEVDFATASYKNYISRARTFGFVSELENLHSKGLARGASIRNAVVMNDYHVMNEDQLRYEDECARHKVLDAIGDIYLLGHPLIGSFSAHKSGHYLNNQLLVALKQDETAWELIDYERYEDMPSSILRLDPAIA